MRHGDVGDEVVGLVADRDATLIITGNGDVLEPDVAQFDGERHLAFFNRPFAIMAQLDPEWLGEAPEFDRVLVVDSGLIVADDEPGPAVAYYRKLIG